MRGQTGGQCRLHIRNGRGNGGEGGRHSRNGRGKWGDDMGCGPGTANRVSRGSMRGVGGNLPGAV